MEKLKIAIYAICKNEEHFVDRWMDSMQPESDMVIVTDTGSTDKTVEKLRNRGAIVHEIKVDPWRFDVARNISLNFVPGNIDVCVCTDLDEVIEPGWREKLEKIWKPRTIGLKYMFTSNFNPDGSRGLTFWKEKIHRRHGFRWIRPVHEVLAYYGEDQGNYAWEPTIQVNHYPDTAKSRGQYLPLLEMSVKEDPDDDRNMHYLGREYMYYGRLDKCIETLIKHLAMPRAQWKDERCASMRFIARAYQAKSDYKEAKAWLYRAIAEAPHLREPYMELAKLAYLERDWPTIYHMVEQTLKLKERPASYIHEAFAWDATVYDLGALSCYQLGMLEKSLKWIKIAVAMSPNDERLKNNLKIIQAKANADNSIKEN